MCACNTGYFHFQTEIGNINRCEGKLIGNAQYYNIIIIIILAALLTLATKHRWRVTAIIWQFLSPSIRMSVRCNPPLLKLRVSVVIEKVRILGIRGIKEEWSC